MKPNTRWLPLFITNFLGVFNNNFIKNLVCFVAFYFACGRAGNNPLIVSLASGLYVISYIFFSPLAGRLAKISAKKKIMLISKIVEIPVFVLSIAGFYFRNIILVMLSVFLLGLISTLFSPSKYGLIRDIGGNEGISFGTGTLEMLTFFGVLAGTITASIVSDHFSIQIISLIVIISSLSSLFSIYCLKVNESETVKNLHDTINPLKFMVQSFRRANKINGLNFVILGLATFWMIGNLIQMNLIVHCPKVLHMTNTQTGIVMTFAAIGIGLGSYFAGVISRGKVELGLTPAGATGMILSLFFIYLLHATGLVFSILVFISAFSCGVYMVPLSAYVQESIEGRLQGDMIAYSNFTSFLLILLSSGLFGAAAEIFDTDLMFLIMVVIVLVITVLMIMFIPAMSGRFRKSLF